MRVLWWLLIAACTPAGTPPKRNSVAEEKALDAAQDAAVIFSARLRAKLLAAMGEGGPQRAIEVCSTEARALAETVATETKVTVGRSSLRLRTAADAGPPWVRDWLKAQGERPAQGLAPTRVLAEGYARVLLPIPIEKACLGCHGPAEALTSEVKAALAQRYPDDHATGYAEGDLRGVLWAELKLNP